MGDVIRSLAEKAAAPAAGAAVGGRLDPFIGTFAGFGVGLIIHAASSIAETPGTRRKRASIAI